MHEAYFLNEWVKVSNEHDVTCFHRMNWIRSLYRSHNAEPQKDKLK
jgi:hypothetical protein